MQLSDFFSSPAAVPLRGRSVKFKIVRNAGNGSRLVADASALLVYVDEKDRAEAIRNADGIINARYKGDPIPSESREDERALHILALALRDEDPPHAPFARTVDELRSALVDREFGNVWAEFNRYIAEEFPPYVDEAEFRRLVDLAAKKPLPDLRTEFDSSMLRRSLPSLASLLLK